MCSECEYEIDHELPEAHRGLALFTRRNEFSLRNPPGPLLKFTAAKANRAYRRRPFKAPGVASAFAAYSSAKICESSSSSRLPRSPTLRIAPLGMDYMLAGDEVRVPHGAGIVDLIITLRRRRIPVREAHGVIEPEIVRQALCFRFSGWTWRRLWACVHSFRV